MLKVIFGTHDQKHIFYCTIIFTFLEYYAHVQFPEAISVVPHHQTNQDVSIDIYVFNEYILCKVKVEVWMFGQEISMSTLSFSQNVFKFLFL